MFVFLCFVSIVQSVKAETQHFHPMKSVSSQKNAKNEDKNRNHEPGAIKLVVLVII